MPASIALTRALVDVAMGRKPADMVIRKGQWVNVQSGEIIPDIGIAIVEGRIAYVGEDVSHCIGKRRRLSRPKDVISFPACWMGTCTSNRVWSL